MVAETAHRVLLEQRAADKIDSGELPVPGGGITRAGAGAGMACDLCGAQIEKSKIEYEVEWCRDDAVRVLRFHLDCFQAWIAHRPPAECQRPLSVERN
ncbi:MAG: hypothetical protein ACJ8R9_15950 [Steroidobacteraceae bacterium]